MKYQTITKILKRIFSVLVAVDVVLFLSLVCTMLNSILGTRVNLKLAGSFSEILQKEITPADVKLMIASMCLLLFITLLLLINIRKLLQCIEKNATPFQTEIVQQLRKIILWWIVVSVLPLWKISDPYPFISIGCDLLFAIILYLLTLIFEYGISLQTEVDETL